jgi:D-amino-acid dehydrogenase
MSSNAVHVAVVGAGIIGLSAAYHLIKQGARVTLVDRDPEGDKCSHGNAGAIAVTEVVPASAPGTLWRVPGWMADPLGPLAIRPMHAPKLIPWLLRFAKVSTAEETERISRALAALNGRAYEDLVPMLRDIGLSNELHREGALSVYESEEGFRRDADEWALKRARGIICEDISGDEARQREPALGPIVKRAVFNPQWSYVSDPKHVARATLTWLKQHGAEIRRSEAHTITPGSTRSLSVQLNGERLTADRIVVAAGAWSALLARKLGDRALLESERGYNMTLPSPGVSIKCQLTFAERKFVATPLSCGLRIGGAAEFGGLNAAPNYKRSRALVDLASRYLPGLRTEGGVSWAGHRPATPDSLPVISRSDHHADVFYAFGHGHLGLTQSAPTGRLISQLVLAQPPSIDVTPYRIGRFT